jgi:hypothetical protein
MECTRCGNAEADDAVFCSNCGASLAARTPFAGAATEPAPIIAETPGPGLGASRFAPSADPYQANYPRTEAAPPLGQAQRDISSPKGFVASLFDFGFHSFVTPKVVKVVYVLVMIMTALAAVAFLLFAFRISAAFGVISLVILCPLYFFINVALWRIALELFVVVFRIADDIRAIRMRGDLR